MAVSRLEERLKDPKSRWYFTKEEIERSPSRLHGVDYDKELSYRQTTATMITDMGRKLKLSQLCTATAIVYMQRFFMVHSFRSVNRNFIAAASLFLAAKIEEMPQKLEYVARVFYSFVSKDNPHIDSSSEKFTKLIEDITYHELLILQTLGFDLQVEQPHPHVVKCTQLVRASRDLSQTAYLMAQNSLALTTFCLEHRPAVVASVCINLACVWKGIEIPLSQDQKKWWEYVDPTLNQELLDTLTKEYLEIHGKSPSKLKRTFADDIRGGWQSKGNQGEASDSSHSPSQSSSKAPPPHDRHHTKPPHDGHHVKPPHEGHHLKPHPLHEGQLKPHPPHEGHHQKPHPPHEGHHQKPHPPPNRGQPGSYGHVKPPAVSHQEGQGGPANSKHFVPPPHANQAHPKLPKAPVTSRGQSSMSGIPKPMPSSQGRQPPAKPKGPIPPPPLGPHSSSGSVKPKPPHPQTGQVVPSSQRSMKRPPPSHSHQLNSKMPRLHEPGHHNEVLGHSAKSHQPPPPPPPPGSHHGSHKHLHPPVPGKDRHGGYVAKEAVLNRDGTNKSVQPQANATLQSRPPVPGSGNFKVNKERHNLPGKDLASGSGGFSSKSQSSTPVDAATGVKVHSLNHHPHPHSHHRHHPSQPHPSQQHHHPPQSRNAMKRPHPSVSTSSSGSHENAIKKKPRLETQPPLPSMSFEEEAPPPPPPPPPSSQSQPHPPAYPSLTLSNSHPRPPPNY